ncbi:MAG: hypothetical protein KGN16_20805 [Burkholderiales bacterium]|nr:hypothetical protein [Burkholderiales bacterium]
MNVAAPRPCVIDVEASGFGRGSYPIEIGYVLDDGRAVCMLVQPSPHWTHWDAGAESIHGIQRSLLFVRGRPVTEVAATLNRDLAGRTVYCDGWANDYTWIAALYEEARMTPTFKLESAARLLDEARRPLLHERQRRARAELGLDRHRASSDARALQCALAALIGTVQAGP